MPLRLISWASWRQKLRLDLAGRHQVITEGGCRHGGARSRGVAPMPGHHLADDSSRPARGGMMHHCVLAAEHLVKAVGALGAHPVSSEAPTGACRRRASAASRPRQNSAERVAARSSARPGSASARTGPTARPAAARRTAPGTSSGRSSPRAAAARTASRRLTVGRGAATRVRQAGQVTHRRRCCSTRGRTSGRSIRSCTLITSAGRSVGSGAPQAEHEAGRCSMT